MGALRRSSGPRLSVLDEVLRAHARRRAWRRLWRAGLAGALLLVAVLISLWPSPAPAPANQVWPGSTVVVVVPATSRYAAPLLSRHGHGLTAEENPFPQHRFIICRLPALVNASRRVLLARRKAQ